MGGVGSVGGNPKKYKGVLKIGFGITWYCSFQAYQHLILFFNRNKIYNHFTNNNRAMNNSEQLSLEQEFHLRMFADKVRTLSPEQVQDLSIELYRQMIHKDNLYRELLKDYWGVDSNPLSV